MPKRILVTAALPYANGQPHIGHLVEYCQADIYVRALKRLGESALYICASDAHGTPIELNAKKQGIAPEALVEKNHAVFQRDFAKFEIEFDHYSITHSATNEALVREAYAMLRAAGALEDRDVDGMWSETDQRFLPDRFIRGTCPSCKTPDQYGDVCESCGATYVPTELIDPRSALSGDRPVVRKTQHVFFALSKPEHTEFLRAWIDSGPLQDDVANYVRNWIDGGLRDWGISRDGPYFGFPIPDQPNKFFYVWLDAPFGYVASSKEWGDEHGVSLDELWRSPSTRIEHFIGKDIVYFHTLFWPAVLRATGYTLPSAVHVHGMLTVNGEKMSKSRGTFINADTFAEHLSPLALRYYYATKYTTESTDLDLSFDDFVLRVNSELVNKHANLFSRAGQFLETRLEGRLGDLPFSQTDAQGEPTGDGSLLDSARQVVARCRRVQDLYRAREFGQVTRELCFVADIGNEYMQAQKPWDLMKTDPEAARTVITFALNVCQALATYLWPIVPSFAEAAAKMLGTELGSMDARKLFGERNRAMGTFTRLFDRIDKKAVEALVAASVVPGAETTKKSDTPKKAEPQSTTDTQHISFDAFAAVDLRVGKIVSAERIKKSDKLLSLRVDLGEGEPRPIVAGLGKAYEPEQLVNTSVVVVANLAPAKIMGHESRGMVLAAGEAPGLSVLRVERDQAPGTSVR